MALNAIIRPINQYNQLAITGATKPTGTSKDDINNWLHSQPWFQAALKQWNVDPNDIHLSPQQRAEIQQAISRAGVSASGVTDVASAGIDSNGNIEDNAMPTWTKIALAGFGAAAGGAALGAFGSGGAATAGGGSTALPAVAGGGLATTSATVPASLAATGGGAAAAGGLSSWLTSPAASLISTGVQAGLGIYATNKQADANAEAARIQAAEFDKALSAQLAEQQYQHSQDAYGRQKDALAINQYGSYLTRLNPYEVTGVAANNRLSDFMGQPPQARTPLPTEPPPAYQSVAQQQAVNTTLPPAPQLPPSPEQQTGVQVGNSQLQAAADKSRGGKPLDYASQGDANGMVLMQAPDGSRKLVPAADVPDLFAKGARRVG